MKRTVTLALIASFILVVPFHPLRGEEKRDYTVVKGDTLWDISEEFYGDPFLWPLLWQQNQHITNPHLIFPGDKVHLYWGPLEVRVEKEEAVLRKPKAPVVKLYNFPEVLFAGFVDPSPPQGVGKVVGGEVADKGHMLEGDVVYLTFRKGVEPLEGEEFTIFRVEGEVKHPRTGATVGQKVSVVGRVAILGRKGQVYRGRVLLSYEGVREGDGLLPYLPPLKELPLLKGSSPLEACLVSSRSPRTLLGEGDVIYLDKGEDDGLKPGLMMKAVRRRAKGFPGGDPPPLPEEEVAKVVVISTRQRTATALILSSREPIQVGDRVEMVLR